MTPNPNYRNETSTGSIPTGTAGTGTVTSDTVDVKYLQGSGTFFTQAYKGIPSEYIYFPASNEVRKVVGIMSDTTIALDRAISVSGAAWEYIYCTMVAFSLANVGGADGEWNGVPFVAGSVEKDEGQSSSSFCQVQTFDATGTTFEITESY